MFLTAAALAIERMSGTELKGKLVQVSAALQREGEHQSSIWQANHINMAAYYQSSRSETAHQVPVEPQSPPIAAWPAPPPVYFFPVTLPPGGRSGAMQRHHPHHLHSYPPYGYVPVDYGAGGEMPPMGTSAPQYLGQQYMFDIDGRLFRIDA